MAKFKVSHHDKAILGANIRRLRKDKKWSQDRLAFEIGGDRDLQSTICTMESGKSQPFVFIVVAIAKALGTTVEYLCTHGKIRNHTPRTARQLYEAGLLEVNGMLVEPKTTNLKDKTF